jgi:hypothetical protein
MKERKERLGETKAQNVVFYTKTKHRRIKNQCSGNFNSLKASKITLTEKRFRYLIGFIWLF